MSASNDQSLATKLDYSIHQVKVSDPDWGGNWVHGLPANLVDGYGAEPYPVAPGGWARDDAPKEGKPAVVVFDYGKPVKVAALAHYFYVPGCRDQMWGDWLSGPSAFKEVKIYTSDDGSIWKQSAHLSDLPEKCPQLLKLDEPVSARYLKLEVLSLAPAATWLRSYEIETYLDAAPESLPSGDRGKAVRRGFPNKSMLKPGDPGTLSLSGDGQLVEFELPFSGSGTACGTLEVRVNDQPVKWNTLASGAKWTVSGDAGGNRLDMQAQFVKAGLLLKFRYHGPLAYPMPKMDVIARPDAKPSEWCIPEYYYSNNEAPQNIGHPASAVPTCISIAGDSKQSLTLVPDTDRSWVGVVADGIYTAFPLGQEDPSALLLASSGGWFSGFEKAVADVFDFNEPRQFAPVMPTVEKLYAYLMKPELWSDKHQMLRSFPDADFFYIFYSLPYAIPALINWQQMTGDATVVEKMDKILRFTLDRRIRDGKMKGAIFSQYADRELLEKKAVPFAHAPYYEWTKDYLDEILVGMDQGANRWVTAHTMGSVLWAVTYVWECRGEIAPDILAASKDVADWMVRFMKEDGSWSYGYREDGSIASPMSDSGTIWNIWSLYRFGKMTGDKRYSDAADKGIEYFKNTFVKNHMYRGYWEDVYAEGRTELHSAQGYESTLAAIAFHELGDKESMISAARDSLRFVCTRTLESRNYWTSYGGTSEQQGWAPGTYMSPTFGRAAQIAWMNGGDDFLARFAGLAKTIGWWIDATGTSFWLGEAVGQHPIEMYRMQGGQRSYWALWDIAHKANFALQWLVDEVNRRSGGLYDIDCESLRGSDHRGRQTALRLFDGRVDSSSGQVNWVWLESTDRNSSVSHQLVLTNHAEATDVTVRASIHRVPVSAGIFDGNKGLKATEVSASDDETKLHMPQNSTVVIEWD